MHQQIETGGCIFSWPDKLVSAILGLISDPLIVSKFHNETHDTKGQENKIYTIVKGRETCYRCHTVPVTCCSEVRVCIFQGQTSWFRSFRPDQWPSNYFKVPQ